jgi:energy-coupling factor transporter ATP-binding protein EcfA2
MDTVLKKNLARDYALTLSWKSAEVDFLGLPNLKEEPVFRLEDIYVPLRLCSEAQKKPDRNATLYVPQALAENPRLVILGDPGCGKSTLIKVLTYAFGDSGANAYKSACGELIPIPIILRDYATRKWRNFEDMLGDFISTLDPNIARQIEPTWLVERLSQGEAILMLDGLDEVGSAGERVRLRDKVVAPLLELSLRSRTLFTSRIVGYEEAPFDFRKIDAGGWLKRFYVAPFDDEDVAQFVTRWYRVREPAPDRQRESVTSLMAALERNDRVKRLAYNPQLLTLIALIHRITRNLPSGRVELYNKITEAYLETIPVYRGMGTPAKLEEMRRWLARVGWKMQERRKPPRWGESEAEELLVSREEITGWLVQAISERATGDAPAIAAYFLDFVARRSGLLVPRGPDRFSFAHLTFQEYFAALQMRGRVRQFDELAKDCANLSAQPHWHETLSLLFEMLADFQAAGDDLVAAIIAPTKEGETRPAGPIAKLLTSLFLDEDSGLSEPRRTEALEYALESAASNFPLDVINDLRRVRDIPPIRNWFEERLKPLAQTGAGRFFFLLGGELIADWPAILQHWLEGPDYRDPGDPRSAEIALVAARDDKVYRQIWHWAARALPLVTWLQRITRSFGSGYGVNLAALYRNALYPAPYLSPQEGLLAEIAVASGLAHSQLMRLAIGVLRGNLSRVGTGRHIAYALPFGYLRGSDENPAGRARTVALSRVLPLRVPARDLARDMARDLNEDGSGSAERALAQFLLFASQAAAPAVPPGDSRRSLLAAAEDALFRPGANTQNLIASLEGLAREPDDWSRLLAESALLTLGAGGPDLCSRRNELLSKGLENPESFSFPAAFRSVTDGKDFRHDFTALLILIFLGAEQWLKPEYFDPGRAESKFFLSRPGEFYAIAAEILERSPEEDPLAPWRVK